MILGVVAMMLQSGEIVDGAGSAAGAGAASGVGRSIISAIGLASGIGAANAEGEDSAATHSGAGAAPGAGAAAAIGAATAAASGAAAGTGAASAVGASTAEAAGAAAGVGAAAGAGPAPTTLDPADKHANIILSNGDLSAVTNTDSVWAGVRSAATFAGGKWHIEVTFDQSTFASGTITGLIRTSSGLNSFPGADASGLGWQNNDNLFYNNGGVHGTGNPGLIGAGDVLVVEIDDDAGTLYVAKNTGSYVSVGYPAGITAGASQTKKFMVGLFTTGNDITVNFGATAFVKTPSSGFGTLTA